MSGPDYRPGREVRVTSATGGEKGQKDIRLGGSDPLAMLELGRVYGVGEKKYARYNYLKGYPWSLSIDALFRHMWQFLGGQEYDECSVHPGQHDEDHVFDPEVCTGSGLLHTAHVAWQALALTSFQMRGIGEDDRAPGQDQPARVILTLDEFETGSVTMEQVLERAGFGPEEVEQFAKNVIAAIEDGGEVTGIG